MIVGIDLGTTHSLIGCFEGNAPRLFPNALGDLLTPSAISVGDDGGILVGQSARDRLITHPQASVAAFKRWMGSNRTSRLGKREFRPEELSALVLRSLLADAEAALGEKVREAVISVPAYFGDAQRKATRAAGELAGIKVERLVNEPTAAALAYGLQERIDGSTFIVLDLGGGTFDVSILEIFDGVMQVHASAGDNHLGGEDFLDAMADACCRDLGIDRRALPASELAMLLARLEAAKKQLSSANEAVAHLQFGTAAREWRIDDAGFQRLAEPLLQRVRAPIERALRDAKLAPGDLSEVVMVGGASRMPLFTRLVTRMLGRLPLRHVHPDQAIALGAAVVGGMKMRNQALEEVVMTDVCPYTLGIATGREDEHGRVSNGHFSPIIERNATVPVSRSEGFCAMQDGQREIRLEIYQGESPRVVNNVLLGTLDVRLAPKMKKNQPAVDVRFTYDVNGVLQVESTTIGTGEKRELILQDNAGVLGEAEIRERLASLSALKVHPREDQANLAAIARIERLYEERLDARGQLQDWLARFMSILEGQDRVRIERERGELSRALDQLEAQGFD
ncbi:MAG TPA: molecular chaperone HscC [Thermomonas sp.]|nr:molecular chaperone HscC [Thermomonas sp.]